MEKEFLPVGSVVLLKGGTKRVMVTGFCSVDNDDATKIYDYTGCLYPEGIINSNEICLFNDNQIEQVFFKGFEDQEEFDFKKNLSKTVNEYYEKNTIKVDDIVDKPQPTATFDINNNIFDNIGD